MSRTERTYYLVQALYHFSWSFLGPVYALFLLSRGLDLLEINLVLATYLVTAFVFEVPMGAVADVFGRKVSFVLSCLVRASAFFLYAVSNSLEAFLFAEFVDAVGTTLATGSLEAWAVDGIRADGDLGRTDRLFARAQIAARTFMIASGLLAGYLADFRIELPWFVATAMFLLTALVASFTMSEPPRARSRKESEGLATTLARGFQDLRGSPVLALLCGLTLVTSFAAMPALHYWQPRMEHLAGEGMWRMGWIFALLNLAAIAGSGLVPRLLRHRREHVLAATACVRGFMLAFAAWTASFYPALFGFVFFEVGLAVSEPLFLAWTNEHAPTDRRATVLSLRAMSFTLGGSLGLVCLGFLARRHGIPLVWFLSAMLLCLSAPGYFLLGRAARRTGAGLAPLGFAAK